MKKNYMFISAPVIYSHRTHKYKINGKIFSFLWTRNEFCSFCCVHNNSSFFFFTYFYLFFLRPRIVVRIHGNSSFELFGKSNQMHSHFLCCNIVALVSGIPPCRCAHVHFFQSTIDDANAQFKN